MPEMLQFCGRRFYVDKIAVKACDTITNNGMDRMHNAVHLRNTRCDGSAHGGAKRRAISIWKNAWLRRIESPKTVNGVSQVPEQTTRSVRTLPLSPGDLHVETLSRATQKEAGSEQRDDPCYAARLPNCTARLLSGMPFWNASSYIRDVRSGNVEGRAMVVCLSIGVFNKVQDGARRLLPERLSIRGGRRFPFIEGRSTRRQTRRSGFVQARWYGSNRKRRSSAPST